MPGEPVAGVRHRRGRRVLAVVFAALTVNAWGQVILALMGRAGDPPMLVALQLLIGATGAAAAWGAWTGARWTPAASLAYGLVTAGMLVALGPLVDVEPDARRGLWLGAAIVLALSVAAAWYLRRTARGASQQLDT